MSKMKVVIVDDETLIRKLIRMKMEVEKLNLEIVGEFSNARSALEKLPVLKPDIILSDICMPEIDGISFSEQCKELLPDAKVIVITGYNDFEYARRSLKAGVSDYLMKPVQTEELNHSLEEACRDIRKQREQRDRQKKILEQGDENRELLLSAYLRKLLIQEADPYAEARLKEYGVDTEAGRKNGIQMGLLAIYESVNSPEILGQMKKEMADFFQGEERLYILTDPWGRLAAVCCGDLIAFEKCFLLFAEYIEQKHGFYLQNGLSGIHMSWDSIHLAYTEALNHMQQRHEERKSRSTEKDAQEWDKIAVCAAKGKMENAFQIMEKQFASLSEREILCKENMVHFYGRFCIALKVEPKQETVRRRFAPCKTAGDIKKSMRWLVIETAAEKMAREKSEKGLLLQKIFCYLRENLQDPELCVNSVIQKFSVSSSFLNRLIKSGTGETCSELISDLRYLNMLELLKEEPGMLDRDIGERIGIMDAHYLSIWFKKMAGISVTEYRKLEEA